MDSREDFGGQTIRIAPDRMRGVLNAKRKSKTPVENGTTRMKYSQASSSCVEHATTKQRKLIWTQRAQVEVLEILTSNQHKQRTFDPTANSLLQIGCRLKRRCCGR